MQTDEEKERAIDEFLAMVKAEAMREGSRVSTSREVWTRKRGNHGVSETVAAPPVTFKIEIW
ncbi:hypothetical protein [Sulfitobacter sp.]|uniref:hypothetical protein n=1 Tax=Sulfitobacter sp. TaxID=1903071 RepID=UPI0025E4EE15|nr:hypothetical protein [Sulfitobacter sp.]